MPGVRSSFAVAAVFVVLAVFASTSPTAIGATSSASNFQGLWWKAPAGSESGWGINLAHQGDVIFATWFTYDAAGAALWLSMTADKTAEGAYGGTLYQTHGPAFSAVPFSPSAVAATPVGSGTLTFSDASNGTFAYTLFGISQTKPITRQIFGPLPTCTFGARADLTPATNYQDLWWAAPAGIESGWGVNFTHQGDTIFATWFTYGNDGNPLWLSATTPKTGTGVYAGAVYRTTGPAFSAVPFLPGNVVLMPVGALTLTFANGNNATFAYAIDGVMQTKQITRQVFRGPGTVCQYAEGIYRGTTGDSQTVRAIILDDQSYTLFYSDAAGVVDNSVAIGTGRADGGQFSSSDGVNYPIARMTESSDLTSVFSLAGSFVPFVDLHLTSTDSRGAHTLAATFVAGAEQPGNLAAAAGSYTGISGHVGGRRLATFRLDANGTISVANDVCVFSGVAAPRKTMSAFDFTLQGLGGCSFGTDPIHGVLYYDNANRKIYAAAPFALNQDLYYVIGTK